MLALAYFSGGFFPDSTAVAAVLVLLVLLVRATSAPTPFAGLSPALSVAAIALIGFGAWTLASGSWSGSPSRAALEYDRLLLYAAILVVTGILGRSARRARLLLYGLAAASVVVSIAAAATWLLPRRVPGGAGLQPRAPGLADELLERDGPDRRACPGVDGEPDLERDRARLGAHSRFERDRDLVGAVQESRTPASGGRRGRRPEGQHNPDRAAVRHGHEAGEVTLGGRRVAVERPRVRTADGEREVALATYAHFADRDPLTRVVLEQMLAGVSTRRFARTREPVGEDVLDAGALDLEVGGQRASSSGAPASTSTR